MTKYILNQINPPVGSARGILGDDVSNLKVILSQKAYTECIRVISKTDGSSPAKWDSTSKVLIAGLAGNGFIGALAPASSSPTYYISRFRLPGFFRCLVFENTGNLAEAAGSWTAQEGGLASDDEESAVDGLGEYFESGNKPRTYRFGSIYYTDPAIKNWLKRSDNNRQITEIQVESVNATGSGSHYIKIHADKTPIDSLEFKHDGLFDALGFGILYSARLRGKDQFGVIRTYRLQGTRYFEFYILADGEPALFYADCSTQDNSC